MSAQSKFMLADVYNRPIPQVYDATLDAYVPLGSTSADVVLVPSAAATVTNAGADQTNYGARGVKVVLDMTVVGTGSVTLTIQGKDTASGKYYTLLAGAAVVTNVTNVYEIYPGLTTVANVAASATLPHTWRVLVTANNANSATYSVGASLIS